MEDQTRIYIPPRKAPRLPRDYYSDDKLNSETMLGAVLWGILAAAAIGAFIWFVRGG